MECLHCGAPVTTSARGRPSKFCSDAHRKAYSRERLNGQKDSRSGGLILGDINVPEADPEGCSRPLRGSLGSDRTGIIARTEFRWRGLDLHLGNRRTPVLTLVADKAYPHLFRIRYPDGWLSTPANISRAKDAAYGHARHLLGGGR
jgi:hypothetical protein